MIDFEFGYKLKKVENEQNRFCKNFFYFEKRDVNFIIDFLMNKPIKYEKVEVNDDMRPEILFNNFIEIFKSDSYFLKFDSRDDLGVSLFIDQKVKGFRITKLECSSNI